jgi:cephalosporin hydroxylase
MDLVRKTRNFSTVSWLGQPVWQNVLDLWVIQETIYELRPALVIECGTNRGGSATFLANLFDLMNHGKVLTIDVEKLHNLDHPRVTFLQGNSVDDQIVSQVAATVRDIDGPIMAILDSDHSASHVSKELDAYAPFITADSFVLVQDGVIDTLPVFGRAAGPLPAIKQFLDRHPEFEVDYERTTRFLITHHPMGWLRRKRSV